MERLFRDRMDYINSEREGGCFICADLAAGDDEARYILARGEQAVVFLNKYPYNTGHVVVATTRHVGDIAGLTEEEIAELMSLVGRCVAEIRDEMKAEGFNLGANLGEVAGAGLPGHFHLHVVPRWAGDTNFMPVIGGAKVLPELLEETYQRLRSRLSESR